MQGDSMRSSHVQAKGLANDGDLERARFPNDCDVMLNLQQLKLEPVALVRQYCSVTSTLVDVLTVRLTQLVVLFLNSLHHPRLHSLLDNVLTSRSACGPCHVLLLCSV